jgi:hypothetical protein
VKKYIDYFKKAGLGKKILIIIGVILAILFGPPMVVNTLRNGNPFQYCVPLEKATPNTMMRDLCRN